jgi:hypothetical protein
MVNRMTLPSSHRRIFGSSFEASWFVNHGPHGPHFVRKDLRACLFVRGRKLPRS